MKIDYDKEVDALYIQFINEPAAETEEIEPGIIVDFSKDARVIGIEVLNVSKRLDVLNSVNELILNAKVVSAG